MEHIILQQGGFTVRLESNGTVSLRENGKLPTLDDIARQRAKAAYMVGETLTSDDTKER